MSAVKNYGDFYPHQQDGAKQSRNYYSLGTYSITCPGGRVISGPPKGSYWRYSEQKLKELDRDARIWWGKDGNNVPAPKLYLSEVKQGVVPSTIWLHKDVGTNQDAKQHLVKMFPDLDDVFITPKPETLINRILDLASNPGDWVLDSFAGSGTTGAVAQKMGRRWIMVELGEHCHTHIIPRLTKVIDGRDPGGVTEAVSWTGGGGFRYFRLAPSLLEKDRFGNWIISKNYNAAMLTEAVCKLEGFRYAPSETVYWQHGRSTEADFIYVTTQTLNREQLAKLSEEVGGKRSLLVMCCAFRCKTIADFPNLTVKKIPKAVLGKCEWGKDDYSLEIKNLPTLAPAPADEENGKPIKNNRQARKARQRQQEPSLFDQEP